VVVLAQNVFGADDRYLVQAELWIDGQQVGTPSLLTAANSPASVSIADDEEGFRLDVLVEPITDAYAPENTLWLHVEMHQKMNGEWEPLADSLLGVAEGEAATFSLVEGDQSPSPETARAYLLISAGRAESVPHPGS
jgi:hypothetical protein